MKKILTLIFALMLCVNVKAQTPLTEAVDFSSVALNGEEVNLFEILDGGQYVLIEFFYSSSSGALTYVNKMIESYQYFGCNEHDVYFMEVSRYDDEDAARAWCDEYGIIFPTIHTESEGVTGDQICEMYGIPSYPTVILIAPDRQIVLQDIWPVLYTDDIINALTPFGIENHECSQVSPEVDMEISKVTSSVVMAEFTPNFVCKSFYAIIGEGDSLEEQEQTVEEIIQEQGVELTGKCTYSWTDLTPETTYNIYVLPINLQDELGEIAKKTVTTTEISGPSVIELIVELESETSVYTKATPDENTSEYHYGLFKKSEYDDLGETTIIEILLADAYPLYEVDEWIWEELIPKTDYYAIAVGLNHDDALGELTMVPFTTDMNAAIELIANQFEVRPNPASSVVNITSVMEGEAEVNIFDMTGRCVKKTLVNDLNDAAINIEDLSKGVYLININGVVEKLIVE